MPDFNRRKRIIYIILGIVVLGVIGFWLYRLFAPAVPSAEPQAPVGISGRSVAVPPTGITEEARPSGIPPLPDLPSIAEQKLIRLTDFAVISPSLNKTEDKVLFYKKDGGDLLASDFRGAQQEKLSNLTIVGLMEAVWSTGRDRAAVFYLDLDSIKGFLHIGTSSVAILPSGITSAAWSPDGKSLAYLLPKEDLIELVAADASGRNPRTVFRTPLTDSRIAWITPDLFIFSSAPSGLAEGYLFSFSRRDNSFIRIMGPAFGLTGLWSPDGSAALVSSTGRGGKKSILSLYRRSAAKSEALTAVTLSEKCAWAGNDTVFCGAARDIPANVILPDDYLRGEFSSADRIIAIDVKTAEVSEVFNEGLFDISSPLVTKDKKYLLFVNRIDGTLWSLKLQF